MEALDGVMVYAFSTAHLNSVLRRVDGPSAYARGMFDDGSYRSRRERKNFL